MGHKAVSGSLGTGGGVMDVHSWGSEVSESRRGLWVGVCEGGGVTLLALPPSSRSPWILVAVKQVRK